MTGVRLVHLNEVWGVIKLLSRDGKLEVQLLNQYENKQEAKDGYKLAKFILSQRQQNLNKLRKVVKDYGKEKGRGYILNTSPKRKGSYLRENSHCSW